METYALFQNPIRNATMLFLLEFRFQKEVIPTSYEALRLTHYFRRPIHTTVVVTFVDDIIACIVLKTDEYRTDLTRAKNKPVMRGRG